MLELHRPMTAQWTPAPAHLPVMVEDVLELLRPRPGAVMVDGTVGAGGHSAVIAPRLLPDGRLIALDRDPEALALAQRRLVEFESSVTFLHADYRTLPELLAQAGVPRVDGVLLDLGVSSMHLDQAARGFSFLHDAPLDMRMDPTQRLTAEELVNTLPADALAALLATLGEERFARRIAHRVIEARRATPIRTTSQLARLVVQAYPSGARHGRIHVATRTFQALRMAVNDELGALDALLKRLPDCLTPGGRAVIISFHSGEDRLVKRAFLELARAEQGTVLTKKPRTAPDEETARNPRARSAKLRAVERRP